MMKKLLLSQDCADVIFELAACGERIFAHKCILAAASDPMKALVTGLWLENQNDGVCVVKVEHSALAMKAMLEFIYVGTIDITNLGDYHYELFDLSAQYDLPDLSIACESVCIKVLQAVGGRSDGVVSMIIAAYVYEKTDMKKACINYIKSKGPTIMMSNAFIELKTSHPTIWIALRKDLNVPDEEQDEDVAGDANDYTLMPITHEPSDNKNQVCPYPSMYLLLSPNLARHPPLIKPFSLPTRFFPSSVSGSAPRAPSATIRI